MLDLNLPFFANYTSALLTLVVSLVVFHLLLVWLWPLGSIAWKKVDYVWLSLALIGVMGGVGNARREASLARLQMAEAIVTQEADEVVTVLSYGTSGAVCRKFVRAEYSPPEPDFSLLQRRFDELCAWFTAAQGKARSVLGSLSGPLTIEALGGGTGPAQSADQWPVDALKEQIERFNRARSVAANLQRTSVPDALEVTLIALGPFLLAIGLALRLTKVTGEIRLAIRDSRGTKETG